MRFLVLFFILVLAGCTSATESAQSTKKERKESVIYVGMLLSDAEAKLKEYGAKEYQDQSLMLMKYARQGYESRKYQQLGGPSLELLSKPGKNGRQVHIIWVSTYRAKSWKSKTDPEVLRFQDSFEPRDEIDLGEKPIQPPQTTTGSSAPSRV